MCGENLAVDEELAVRRGHGGELGWLFMTNGDFPEWCRLDARPWARRNCRETCLEVASRETALNFWLRAALPTSWMKEVEMRAKQRKHGDRWPCRRRVAAAHLIPSCCFAENALGSGTRAGFRRMKTSRLALTGSYELRVQLRETEHAGSCSLRPESTGSRRSRRPGGILSCRKPIVAYVWDGPQANNTPPRLRAPNRYEGEDDHLVDVRMPVPIIELLVVRWTVSPC